MAIVRLQPRGMLTAPHDIRQQLHLEDGQPLKVRIVDARRRLIEVLPTLIEPRRSFRAVSGHYGRVRRLA